MSSSTVSEADDFVIRVRDVSKHYLIYAKPEDRLKQMVLPRLARAVGREAKPYFRDFSAVGNVSLEVGRGETVGIIGRNGSGKSTLLQMICGTLQPTAGTIEVRGRIAALLELGAGFNPEFSGRENVYLNATILGLSTAEIDARYDKIAAFADIGHFIDQPVKTYSSGMYVRLAFAVAINVDPAILVVDEALAVGDEAFQRKCFARIEQIKAGGATILFVSHGAQTIVQLCDRAILLDAGEKLIEGKPKFVVSQYRRLLDASRGDAADKIRAEIRGLADGGEPEALPAAAASRPAAETKPHHDESRWDPHLRPSSTIVYESHGATITDVRIENRERRVVNILSLGHQYSVVYTVAFSAEAEHVVFGFQVKTLNGLVLAGANNDAVKEAQLRQVRQGQTCTVRFDFHCRFLPGAFVMDVGVRAMQDEELHILHRILDAAMFRVAPERRSFDHGLFSLSSNIEITTDRPAERAVG